MKCKKPSGSTKWKWKWWFYVWTWDDFRLPNAYNSFLLWMRKNTNQMNIICWHSMSFILYSSTADVYGNWVQWVYALHSELRNIRSIWLVMLERREKKRKNWWKPKRDKILLYGLFTFACLFGLTWYQTMLNPFSSLFIRTLSDSAICTV